PAATNIRFGFDPIGAAATAGARALRISDLAATLGAAVSDLAAQGFRGPFAPADGRVIHGAGGSEAQELAYVLAVAVGYLRALEAGGIALDAARRMGYFPPAGGVGWVFSLAHVPGVRIFLVRVVPGF